MTISILKKLILPVLISFLASNIGWSQVVVSGIVSQPNGAPIAGANVYLEGTYDGSSTDEFGEFHFETSETGILTLIISSISFETFTMAANAVQLKDLKIILKEDVNSLDTVVISAGTFEANDASRVSVLKALDVVTTASALGDFIGALQTLPGTATVAEDGRLFVRGGDASETQIFIDGIRVFSPYTPSTNNSPTRGRYSPFLFDGITFSTGGYSAEFGQALSSVLLLNTVDIPDQEKTDIGIMSVGATFGNTQKWKKSSLSVNGSYINLAPYIAIFPDRNDWQKPYEVISGVGVFRQEFKQGLLKAYAAFDATSFQLTLEDINIPDGVRYKLKNNNFYANSSYEGNLDSTWKIFLGGSYSLSINDQTYDSDEIDDTENAAHFKFRLRKRLSNKFKLSFGGEQFITNFNEYFKSDSFNTSFGYNDNISAVFTEGDVTFSRKFAIKLGLRGEYSGLFDEFTLSPRASFAYKIAKNSQLSFAYGDFYQQQNSGILKYTSDLQAQKTQHYIFNYQYVAHDRIFRAEIYRKDYNHLITYETETPEFDSHYNANGDGYAQGIDVFWRDNESIKNVDYWVSYSFLDTERLYQNYPNSATPTFVNTHNLSVVGKYWIEDWKSQVGFSYTFGSGRPYTDLNRAGF